MLIAMNTCPDCGAHVPDDAPAGFCPKCLFSSASADPEEARPTVLDHERPDTTSSPAIRSFGDYELLEEIARGGMGVVYKARQINLDRIVAVKMILGGSLASKEFIHRFRTEAAAAANLQHPNIVGVHEVGSRHGEHFLAMDFVDGPNLSRLVGQRPLPAPRAARYVQAIASAIQYAHERGILHRDLKPSNILIGSDDQPRVSDFGLAKRLDVESELTLSGQVLGSPNYMSPEQAGGKRGLVGNRSDVYSLGAILYHVLTARPPFQAETLTDTLQEVVNAEPVSPRLLNPSVPPDLETICLKCLEKEQRRRYQTAQELADELGRFLRDEPILARPTTRSERAWRWCRRKPIIAALAASLVVVFIAGSTGVLTQWRSARINSEANRQQVARLNVLSGVQLMQAGDYFKSLLWFTEALRTDAGHIEREGIHRMRIASVLQQSPRLVQVISHDGISIVNAAFNATDDRLATVSLDDRRVRVWEIPSGKLLTKTQRLPGMPYSVLFSPDGSRLLVVLSPPENKARMFDAVTGEPLGEPLPHFIEGAWNHALLPSFDATGKRLVTQPRQKELQVWDVRTGARQGEPMIHKNQIERMQFSAEGSRLLTRTEGLGDFAWDTKTGAAFAYPIIGPEAAGSLFLGPRDDVALVAGRVVKLSVTEAGKDAFHRVPDLSENSGTRWNASLSVKPLVSDDWLLWAAFSPEGERVVTASRDRTARVWDALTGQPLTPPLPHDRAVSRAAFSPDGHRVLTVSQDNLTRVWDADTGRPLTPPIPHAAGAGASAFSGSGRYLLTVHPSYVACLWDLHQETVPPVLLRSGGAGENFTRSGAFVSQEMNNLLRVRNPFGSGDVTLHPISVKTIPAQAWPDETGRFILLEGELARVQVWDAASGMPLTPQIQSRHTLDEAASRSVKLPPIDMPLDDLVQLAQLLAGSKLDGKGGWTLLELEEMIAAWERLAGDSNADGVDGASAPLTPALSPEERENRRHRMEDRNASESPSQWSNASPLPSGEGQGEGKASVTLPTASAFLTPLPSLLGPPSTLLTHWHRHEAATAEGASDWWAASFHWRKLAALQPGSPEIAQRLDYTLRGAAQTGNSAQSYPDRRRMTPPRDLRADARQIDLTAHYTAPLTEGFSDARREIGLPLGLQKLNGVIFDVRGLVQLSGREPDQRGLKRPDQITGIRIHQRALKLHFLHTEQWADTTEGEEIAALTVRYANGQQERLPLEHAVHLAADWSSASSAETKQARVAWIGTTSLANANQNSVRLYQYTWPNPHPDWEIARVDLASAKTKASYVLVAITVE